MRRTVLSVGLALLLVGCAGFTYRYYGLDLPDYSGTLLGPTPKDDKPFTECKPDQRSKGKCVVLFSPEFFAMKQELETLRQQLKDCQSGH